MDIPDELRANKGRLKRPAGQVVFTPSDVVGAAALDAAASAHQPRRRFRRKTDPGKDFWENRGSPWVRHHVRARNTLFTPFGEETRNEEDLMADVLLMPERITVMSNGGEYRDD